MIRVAVAILLIIPIFAETPEWSVWRGPLRNGNYDHETRWSIKEPKKLWEAKVHLGYSGCAVSEGRVYTLGNAEGEDLIQSLDLETGKEIWTEKYPQDLVPKYNPGGPNAPPVIEGKWLYVFSKQGLVSCLDKATGKARWTTDLAKVAEAPMPTWGFSSAPLILEDRVILNANEHGVALDRETGAMIWNSPSSSCGYAAAVPMRCRGKDAVAIFGEKAMRLVSQSDGKVLWKRDWATRYGENSADPQVIDGKLYLSSWWGEGAALFDPEADAVEPIWVNKEFQNHIQPPVLHEGHLYGFDGPVHKKKIQGFFRCVDARTGKTVWSQPDLKGSVILSNGKLILLTHDGTVIVIKADSAGYEELAKYEGYGKRTWAPPVLHDGRLFIRDADGLLTCLDMS
ncbi:MAG: PQQ-binding-like beta-propeller repeat protein [Verrucomicrobiaceae bacterium]